jgi:hypothetical protein
MNIEMPPNKLVTKVFGGASIVAVADEINVSTFKPFWLNNQGILSQDELSGECLFTPGAVQIPTKVFSLLVLPNRIQIAFAEMEESLVMTPLHRVIGGILNGLPHTPFKALGFNFEFFVGPEDPSTFGEWNHRHFYSPCSALICPPQVENTRFGSYSSINFNGMRLKLDVKPVRGTTTAPAISSALENSQEWMHFAFNYHLDLDLKNPARHAQDSLAIWPTSAANTRSVIDGILG